MQVSKYLRKTEVGYTHWCPGCKEMHPLPNSWTFDGDVNNPTFNPSFKHEGCKTIKDENGCWTGEWELDGQGKPIQEICHYHLHNGILHFCPDCSHDLKNQSIPLPELPDYYKD